MKTLTLTLGTVLAAALAAAGPQGRGVSEATNHLSFVTEALLLLQDPPPGDWPTWRRAG